MCGISFYLNKYRNIIENSLSHRGPDNNHVFSDNNVTMEFNRLAINDLSDLGNQPLELNNCVLICNGEIFNYRQLIKDFDFKTISQSDCEVIIHLYLYLKKKCDNIYQIVDILCNSLDGEFAFCLYDITQQFVLFARDPFGVRPLFYDTETFSFASELKAFTNQKTVKQFPPANFSVLSNFSEMSFMFPYDNISINKFDYSSIDDILKNVNYLFTNAVKKRIMSERNICALLSGGLDSSLVASLVQKHISGPLKTYSIGLKGSPDLMYAKKVADFIHSDHTSVEMDKEDFLNAIETVIQTIESYDTTTVRASVGNYLIAKYIKNNSDCVVVFNGDYADELCGGYRYFKNCKDPMVFHEECCRLVKDICYFDSLRSDRSISANGLEARVPFADKDFVHYYLSIHPALRMSSNVIEKNILRKAFENDNLLPSEVLWRNKEAFSDGVSVPTESWGDIIQQYVNENVSDEEFLTCNSKQFKLKETYFYHKIFSKYYQNDSIIPYLWMPKFCDENIIDPSARKL
jgi:asparagine synthase (glutamine-hydrolysing)